MKKLIYTVLILVFSSTTYATEANSEDKLYVCVSDLIVALVLDEETHERRSMVYEMSRKYLVKATTEPKLEYAVEEIGGGAGMKCREGFKDDGDLDCSGLNADFRMNSKNLGYLVQGSQSATYPTGTGHPYVEVGQCIPQ